MDSQTGSNPDIQWAIDLLTPDPNYEPNFISKWYHYIIIPPMAVGGVTYVNWFQRRPWYSGKFVNDTCNNIHF